MPQISRHERLAADVASLQALEAVSSVFGYESSGEPPAAYSLIFRGRGLTLDASSGRIRDVHEHHCDLRMTLSYPERPPEIRWQTPLLHPNISFGGFIQLSDVGLPWTEDLALDVICERLWDVARLAYYDLEHATNVMARRWLETQRDYTLPVDFRPLRDRMNRNNTNVVRYRHRDGRQLLLPEPDVEPAILYIDENTPVPTLQIGRPRAGGEDEILYIGD